MTDSRRCSDFCLAETSETLHQPTSNVKRRSIEWSDVKEGDAKQHDTEPNNSKQSDLDRIRPSCLELEQSSSPPASKIVPSPNVPEPIAKALYTPLLQWETRLLAIQPGNDSDELTADLLKATATLEKTGLGIFSEDRVVEYEALSYTWGEPNFTHSLRCNEHVLPITHNLSEALRHLRRPDERRLVWVDAICINQSDMEEKARQIQNLYLIFRRAAQVIVWLGRESPSTESALTFIKAVSRSWRSQLLRRPQPGRFGDVETRQCLEDLFKCAHARDICTGLEDLFERPWLTRCWVVQEVYAARTISVHCGSLEMEWESFATAARTFREMFRYNRTTCSSYLRLSEFGGITAFDNLARLAELVGVTAIHHLARLRIAPVQSLLRPPAPRLFHLRELLEDLNHLTASDDRDRVFALLGVAKEMVKGMYADEEDGPQTARDYHSDLIPVDYKKSMSEVYQQLMKSMINVFQSFLLLSFKKKPTTTTSPPRRADIHDEISSLPSWTPDWRNYELGFIDIFRSALADCFNNRGLHRRFTPWILQDLNEVGILRITGVVIATLTSLDSYEHDSYEEYWHADLVPNIKYSRDGYYSWNREVDETRDTISSHWAVPRCSQARAGDLVVLPVCGSPVRFVLREMPGRQYRFVSDAMDRLIHLSSNLLLAEAQKADLRCFVVV